MAIGNQDRYKSAVNHYLSPKRKDSVKSEWEELFSCTVIGQAIQKLEQTYSPKSLRIMDFGCGIGGGLVLVQNALDYVGLHGKDIYYFGLDNSLEMVKVAEKKWEDTPNVNFQVTDFRFNIPDQPTEIYLSCGVPYSHLTKEETRHTLENIFRVIKKNQTQSLVVIDVLGQYSIEWVSQWNHSRWPYRMSFLAEGQEQESMMMTCYYSPELKQMIHEAAEQENCKISDLEFFDRSIMVGRHTSTREYNPVIPPYREVINSLYKSEDITDFQELLFRCELPLAPSPVKEFFEKFSQMWNQLVLEAAEFCGEHLNIQDNISLPEQAAELKQELSRLQESNFDHGNFRANFVEPTLAKYLCRLESSAQPGLGVGHTLIAILSVNGKD
ncbi:MAG: class I SAM-dependent methyltransferase [Brasilonema angustatum HA4187-MV1]|nr:class I SAM-dependent methyltransferase [Brasilonema angustatum HA4187-MV1]